MGNTRFLRDGWKVMLVTVTILALILTGMLTLSFKKPVAAKAEVDKTEVEALVKKAALIFANSIPHDKFLSSSASVIELNITDNGIEAIVNTEQTFVLDYNTPYDEPYLKGMMQKLKEDKSVSSVEEVSIANEYIKERAAAIQYEMENPATVYCTYKLIASSLEEAQKGNFTVYIWTNIDKTQNGVIENWIPTDFYSSTDEEMTKKGYESLDTYVSAVQKAYTEARQNIMKKESNGIESVAPVSYNHAKAASYARTYTSNTSKTRTCSDGVVVKQDTSYYNSAYFSLCADCANYVSQALRAGGIPIDSVWYPSIDSSAWITISGLIPHISSLGWLTTVGYSSLIPGDIITINNAGHIMMVTNTDPNYIYASAHTDDVVDQRILNSAGRVWYHVNNTTGGIQ